MSIPLISVHRTGNRAASSRSAQSAFGESAYETVENGRRLRKEDQEKALIILKRPFRIPIDLLEGGFL